MAEADATVTSRNIPVDEYAFGKEVFSHDAVVGATTGPDDGLFSLCGDGMETGGEIMLYRSRETAFVLVEVFDQISEERSGLEYGTLDDGSEIEGFR